MTREPEWLGAYRVWHAEQIQSACEALAAAGIEAVVDGDYIVLPGIEGPRWAGMSLTIAAGSPRWCMSLEWGTDYPSGSFGPDPVEVAKDTMASTEPWA